MGYVFQSFHLLPTLNAFENVEFAAQLVGIEKEERIKRVNDLFEQVGLSHRMDHLPNALSGGERQRVAIARALVHQPGLVLADEPTGNLDSENADIIQKLFKKINKELDLTIVLVTHNTKFSKIANKCMVLKDGEWTN